MKTRLGLIILLALALALPVAALIIAAQAGAGRNALPPRRQGPCDIYAAAGAQVSGSGITLAAALAKAHEDGAPLAGSVPTSGAPNHYAKRRQ